MLDETCVVPEAACCTLREISCVAPPCCSTEAAIVAEISDSRPMVALIISPFDRQDVETRFARDVAVAKAWR